MYLTSIRLTGLIFFSILLLSPPPVANGARNIDSGTYIQKLNNFALHNNYRPLTLNRAIEQGVRKNFDQQKRAAEKQILELSIKNATSEFWIPSVDLIFSTGGWYSDYGGYSALSGYSGSYGYSGYYGLGGHTVEVLRSKQSNPGITTPSGYLGLVIEDYTIFNWGRDYLAYLIVKDSLARRKDSLNDKKRYLRHSIISKFFELSYRKNIVKIRKDRLRHASFIYRLNKEKLGLKKITRQEFYQSRGEYLNAQELFQNGKISSDISDEEMTTLIADPSGTRYILRHKQIYIPLQITLSDALLIAEKNNPGIIDSKVGITNAKRAYQIQRKNNLPLPTFSIHLGAYGHSFGNGINTTKYSNGNSYNDLNIVASIHATWSIVGSGGFMNGRHTETAALNQFIAIKQLEQSKHTASSDVMTYFTKAKYGENLITILSAKVNTLQRSFDNTLENYMQKRTGFIYLKESLKDMSEAKESLALAKFEHGANKLLLATTIGLDDFPGDNFEKHISEVRDE